MTSRVALYARYSSDQQNPASIVDQFAAADRHAAARGWTVVARFEDAAISGAAMANRPGLLALMAAAEGGAFDRVLVEHEDRLSRSLAHLADVAQRLKYARVTLSTLATDQVSTLHVAFNGAMAEEYLTNLSQKTRRGMTANAEKGLATGSRLYGYRSAPGGAMSIVEDEANTVRRIFQLYGDGLTAREIAAQLNSDGVVAPRGGHWTANQISGSRQRANGILHTELYTGVKVWNRLEVRKDPRTGRRLSIVRPREDWKRTPAPNLRILPQPLWNVVAARQETRKVQEPGRRLQARSSLFAGLYKCGACGGSYTTYTGGRLICTAHREKGPTVCANGRTVSRQAMDARVLEGLRTRLLDPEAVRLYMRTYHDAWSAEAAARRADTAPLEARLQAADRRISRIIDAICEGQASPAMNQRLAELEAEKADLEAQLARISVEATAAGASTPITLHPRLPELYAARVAQLQDHLAVVDHPADRALVDSIRDLVDRITITPTSSEKAAPVEVTLHGRLALLLDGGPLSPPQGQRSRTAPYGVRMVAGARYHRPPTSVPDTIPIAV